MLVIFLSVQSMSLYLKHRVWLFLLPLVVIVFCFVIKQWKSGTRWKRGRDSLLCLFLFGLPLIHINTHKYTAQLETGKQKLWIGLVLDPEHGWQWSDGKPFRYLRWAAGRSSPQLKGVRSYTQFLWQWTESF